MRVSEDAPVDVRTYLEAAISSNQQQRPGRINDAKKAIQSAETHLDDIRKRYRKRKATDADLSAAIARVESMKKTLENIPQNEELSYPSLMVFDQPGAMGTLPHGMGVSRVVDASHAIVYPFVERKVPVEPGLLFDVSKVVEIEITPTATPLLMVGVATDKLKEGDKIPPTQTIYRVGQKVEVDGQTYWTLTAVEIERYLIRSQP